MDGTAPEDAPSPAKLGRLLQHYRELQRLSVRRAAAAADISSTYLSQLEAGAVKDPSPRVLHRLADTYQASYTNLMRAAGYLVPTQEATTGQGVVLDSWDIALRTTSPLTDNEREALAEYLAWYRSRRGQPPEER
jgi:transcriptional regulator with XRE-family HTH domain